MDAVLTPRTVEPASAAFPKPFDENLSESNLIRVTLAAVVRDL